MPPIKLNFHLDNLGWLAKLQVGEPWFIQVIPSRRQFPHQKPRSGSGHFTGHRYYRWYAWIEDARPSGGWFVESLFLDAFISYLLPTFAAIICFIPPKNSCRRHGLRVGHLTPIPDPSISLFQHGYDNQILTNLAVWNSDYSFITKNGCTMEEPRNVRLGALMVPTTWLLQE